MNKKYLVFGLMGLFAMALVTAGLVGYLSNKAEVSVTVESPVLLEVSTDGDAWVDVVADKVDLILKDSEDNSVQGGESVTFFIRDKNLANVPIVGYS